MKTIRIDRDLYEAAKRRRDTLPEPSGTSIERAFNNWIRATAAYRQWTRRQKTQGKRT